MVVWFHAQQLNTLHVLTPSASEEHAACMFTLAVEFVANPYISPPLLALGPSEEGSLLWTSPRGVVSDGRHKPSSSRMNKAC